MKAGNVQSQALIQIIKTRIPHTHLHSEQVAGYAVALAKATELSSKQISAIHISALLHDVGKLGVPDEILTKAKDLTADEFFQIRIHKMYTNPPLNTPCGQMKYRLIEGEALAK
ncbi:MAG TPA: HD domain-containing protein [Phycisphaerae bacterium]|nr:HD domain-containing protein [Phycisphaerae bacterium]